MHLMELIRSRQSVRRYLDRPVERETILECLEAARLAPSASNAQPWRFIVVDEPPLREAVARTAYGKLVSFNRFASQAPVLVALATERSRPYMQVGEVMKRKRFALIDIGIAAEHFCLRAAELGLGTCMLGWFNEREVKRLLAVPASKRVDLLIAVGYPAEERVRPKKRKSLPEIHRFNCYG
jgi:nitroreductase